MMQVAVRDLMTAQPVTVHPDTTLDASLELLLRECVVELYVVDHNQRLVGVLPDYELLKAQLTDVAGDARVESMMTCNLQTVHPDTPAEEAAVLFRTSSHRQLAVVRNGYLYGHLGRRDVMRLLHSVSTLNEPVEADSSNSKPAWAESAIRGPRFSKKQRRGRDSTIGR